MMGGLVCDWLTRRWIRGTRVVEGTPHHISSHPLSYHSILEMDPTATGTCTRSTYILESTVGSITQVENRVFARSFDSTGPYPGTQQVSPLWDSAFGSSLTADRF